MTDTAFPAIGHIYKADYGDPAESFGDVCNPGMQPPVNQRATEHRFERRNPVIAPVVLVFDGDDFNGLPRRQYASAADWG